MSKLIGRFYIGEATVIAKEAFVTKTIKEEIVTVSAEVYRIDELLPDGRAVVTARYASVYPYTVYMATGAKKVETGYMAYSLGVKIVNLPADKKFHTDTPTLNCVLITLFREAVELNLKWLSPSRTEIYKYLRSEWISERWSACEWAEEDEYAGSLM